MKGRGCHWTAVVKRSFPRFGELSLESQQQAVVIRESFVADTLRERLAVLAGAFGGRRGAGAVPPSA
jgi:hypothetical protein